jgi:hypothetical protein
VYLIVYTGAEMKVIAVIEDPDELKRILRHPGCMAEQQFEGLRPGCSRSGGLRPLLILIGSTDSLLAHACRETYVCFPAQTVP